LEGLIGGRNQGMARSDCGQREPNVDSGKVLLIRLTVFAGESR